MMDNKPNKLSSCNSESAFGQVQPHIELPQILEAFLEICLVLLNSTTFDKHIANIGFHILD